MKEDRNRAKVLRMFGRWKKKYLKNTIKAGIYSSALCGEGVLEPYEQIEFMRIYVGFMLVNGLTRENLKRIGNFLSLQDDENELVTRSVHFCGDQAPEVSVLVSSPEDVDMADVHAITGFSVMKVTSRRKWNSKSAASFVNSVKEDLEYDHGEVDIDHNFDERILEIRVNLDSEIGMLRLGAAMKNNFLK